MHAFIVILKKIDVWKKNRRIIVTHLKTPLQTYLSSEMEPFFLRHKRIIYWWKISLNNKAKWKRKHERKRIPAKSDRTTKTRRDGEFYVIRVVFDLYGIGSRVASSWSDISFVWDRKKEKPETCEGPKFSGRENSTPTRSRSFFLRGTPNGVVYMRKLRLAAGKSDVIHLGCGEFIVPG